MSSTPSNSTSLPTLEIEDEDERQRRLQSTLERLNMGSSTLSRSEGLPRFDFGDRTTHPVDPPSELLARVQAFLPQMEASNVALAQQVEADPQSVDIENVDEQAEQYIEMNLGLGVYELRPRSNPSQDDNNPRSPLSDSESESGDWDGDDDESGSGSSSSSRSTTSGSSSTSSSNSDSGSGSDADTADEYGESDEEVLVSSSTRSRSSRPIKPLPRRARPLIEVIGDVPSQPS